MLRHRFTATAGVFVATTVMVAGCGGAAGVPVAGRPAAEDSAPSSTASEAPSRSAAPETTLPSSTPTPTPPPPVELNPDDFLHADNVWWVHVPDLGWDCEISAVGRPYLNCAAGEGAAGVPELVGREAGLATSSTEVGIRKGFAGISRGQAYYGAYSGDASVFADDAAAGGPGRGPDLADGDQITLGPVTCLAEDGGFVCADGDGAGVRVLADSYQVLPRDGQSPFPVAAPSDVSASEWIPADSFIDGAGGYRISFEMVGWDCTVSSGAGNVLCDGRQGGVVPPLQEADAAFDGIVPGLAGLQTTDGGAWYGADPAYSTMPGQGLGLAPGTAVDFGAARCLSQTTGFSCWWPGSGQGFTIDLTGYQVFPRDAAAPTIEPAAPAAPPPAATIPGDLGLVRPMTKPLCDGTAAVFLGAETDPGQYVATVSGLLAQYPDAQYLRTDQACSSLNQQSENGTAIYAVYRAVPAGTDACAAVDAAGGDAYARWLDNTDPSVSRLSC